jgi:hypothetical protein
MSAQKFTKTVKTNRPKITKVGDFTICEYKPTNFGLDNLHNPDVINEVRSACGEENIKLYKPSTSTTRKYRYALEELLTKMQKYGLKLKVGRNEDEVIENIFQFKRALRKKENEREEIAYERIRKRREPIVIEDEEDEESPIENLFATPIPANNQIEILEMRDDPIEKRVKLSETEMQELRKQRDEREYGQFVTDEYPEEADRLAMEERVNELATDKGMFIVDEETIVNKLAFE